MTPPRVGIAGAEGRRGTSFRVLRHRDFTLCWSGSLISATGSWMQNVTVPFVVYRMTGSTTWLGFAGFMSLIGATVGGPIGGSLADRYSRRWMLVVTLSSLAAFALAIWAVWTTGVATPGIIVSIVGVAGVFTGMNNSAWQAFIPQLVDPEELADAVRLNSMQFTIARAIGPACAGLVLETLGASAAFLLNAVSYAFVIAPVLIARSRPQTYSTTHRSLVDDFRDGLRYVHRRKYLSLPIVLSGVGTMLGTAVVQLAPAIATDMFDVGRGAYAFLVAAFGVGAVCGIVLVSIVADHYALSAATRNGVVGLSLSVVALGLAPVYGAGVAAMFAMGALFMVFSTALATFVQSRVDDAYRGRVVAVYYSVAIIAVPIGALLEGVLASVMGLRVVVVGAGLLLLIYSLYVLVRYRRLRMLDESGDDFIHDVTNSATVPIRGADG
jgi:MFS family permease